MKNNKVHNLINWASPRIINMLVAKYFSLPIDDYCNNPAPLQAIAPNLKHIEAPSEWGAYARAALKSLPANVITEEDFPDDLIGRAVLTYRPAVD